MDSEPIVSTEVVSALGVFLGALAGGVAAIVAELRRPVAPGAADAGDAQEASRVIAAALEESGQLSRTIWPVEKKIGEPLHRIACEVLARGGKPVGGERDHRRAWARGLRRATSLLVRRESRRGAGRFRWTTW